MPKESHRAGNNIEDGKDREDGKRRQGNQNDHASGENTRAHSQEDRGHHSHTAAIVVVEVEDAKQEITFKNDGSLTVRWVHRKGCKPGDSENLMRELTNLSLPHGDFFTWVAAEKVCAKQIEAFLVSEKRANADWIKATGYWNKNSTHN